MGRDDLDPFAARATTIGRRHVRARPSLVDEDQALRLQLRLPDEPGGAGFGDVGSVRLGGARRCLRASPGASRVRHAFVGEATAQAVDGEIGVPGDQRTHPFGAPRQPLRLAPAHRLGREGAALTPPLHQLHHEADAHLVRCRHLPARPALRDGTLQPLTPIARIRSRHPSLASFSSRDLEARLWKVVNHKEIQFKRVPL